MDDFSRNANQPESEFFKAVVLLKKSTDLAENSCQPFVQCVTDSHDNEVNGILLQKTTRHFFPVKIIVLNITQSLGIAPSVVKLNDGFIIPLFVVSDDEQVAV